MSVVLLIIEAGQLAALVALLHHLAKPSITLPADGHIPEDTGATAGAHQVADAAKRTIHRMRSGPRS